MANGPIDTAGVAATRSLHFLVCALGSAGDVHPFIAVAQALVARGHGVRLMAAPPFEERVRRAGIEFIALGAAGEYERLVQRAELWDPRRGSKLILDELLDRLPDAYAATAALDLPAGTVLVGSTLAWHLRVLQEVRGLPAATVHLSPVCIASAVQPPVLPGIGDYSWMPAWLVRALQWAVERLVIDGIVGPRLNRLRASLSLPPVKRILSRWMHSPDLVIAAWPDWFAPPQDDWPPHTVTTGFPVFAERAEPNSSLDAFLAEGDAPVGITPGSAMAHGERFFERGIEACRASGKRAVLITPYREQLPSALPEWVHHVGYAPFGELLPRLSALIHHGGIGTSAQALAAGIPQLVVPFAHDQFDNAARLERLGVSRTSSDKASASEWARALRHLLESGDVAGAVARSRARMVPAETPAESIARRLEALDLAPCDEVDVRQRRR